MALLQRLNRFLSKPVADDATVALYGACVAQARNPVFYAAMGVADSLDGRFDVLVLHAILLMRRMGDAVDAKQKLFDLMFADMERNLREMGVGDMSIGKKMKPMIQAFYGRGQAYLDALRDGDAALTAALTKNLYAGKPVDAVLPQRMAAYVRQTIAVLDQQPIPAIVAGTVTFAPLQMA